MGTKADEKQAEPLICADCEKEIDLDRSYIFKNNLTFCNYSCYFSYV